MLFILCGFFIFMFFQHIWFLIALWKKRNDFADVAWALGFPLYGVIHSILSSNLSARPLIILGCVTLWAFRLAFHISQRMWVSHEDARYQAMRNSWKGHEIRNSYLRVFMLQGLLLSIVALPVIVIFWVPIKPFQWSDWLGISLFLTGFMIESVADWQLSQFKKIKKPGQIMQTGLWRYSRHPNYFGEILLWWGLGIMVSFAGTWIAIIGPLCLTFLIITISGIPLIEGKYKGNPEFEKYKQRTSMLWLWFPKKTNG